MHHFVWLAVFAVALVLASVELAFNDKNIWSDWLASSELQKPKYTETVQTERFIRTRANTWSNLAYIVVGFYAISFGYSDWRRTSQSPSGYLCQTPAMSISFGLACCYLGVGSGLFHASLTRLGQQVDVAAMYSPLLVMIAMQLGSWFPHVGQNRARTWPVLIATVAALSGLLFYYKWSMSSVQVLVTLIVILMGLTLVDLIHVPRRMNVRLLVSSMTSLLLAVICRQLDVAGKFSSPSSIFQGHAFWHILTAASLGCMMFYYRTQNAIPIADIRENH